MILVECPFCHKKISHLNIVGRDGKPGWGFCPICQGELTKEQTKALNEEYGRQSKQEEQG
jgi:hypothetical protein